MNSAGSFLIALSSYVAFMLHGLAGVVCNSLELLGIACDKLQHEIRR
jgi:hypothetical protein